MVLVCLPSDVLSQHLPSYLGFSYLSHEVSPHGCSSKAQPLLLTLNEGCLLTAIPPDLESGVAPLGPPAPVQTPLLRCGVALLRGSIRTLNLSCTKIKLLPLTTNMLLIMFSYQAPLSMGLSRQGYWSGLPFPSPSLLALVYKFKSVQAVEHLCVTRDVSNIIN